MLLVFAAAASLARGAAAVGTCNTHVPLNQTVPFVNCSDTAPLSLTVWAQDCWMPETACLGSDAPTNASCVGLPSDCDSVACCSGCAGLCDNNNPQKGLHCYACQFCCFG